jgi:AcrR family transcriptional regulator
MNQSASKEMLVADSESKADSRLTQAERTEISDRKMFDATVQLIVKHGPAATSLKDVGVHAGYSRGLASHRFGSKENLFTFTLKRLGEMWLRQLTKATSGHVGIVAVEKALGQHYQFCVEAPDYVRTFYKLWFESVNASQDLSGAIKAIHQRRHDDVVKWIVDDQSLSESVKQNADSIAGQFGASVIGIVYYWLANPEDLERVKQLHDDLTLTMTQLITR